MHLVAQNILDIHCNSQELGKKIHSRVGQVMEQQLYPKLEVLLQQYDVENYVWTIDQLTISIPNLNPKNWESELVELTLLQVEEFLKNNKPVIGFLNEAIQSPSISVLTLHQQAVKLLFHYLKNGVLLENTIAKRTDEVWKSIQINAYFITELLAFFVEHPQALLRFVLALPAGFRAQLKQNNDPQVLYLIHEVELVLQSHSKPGAKALPLINTIFGEASLRQQWLDLVCFTHQVFRLTHQKNTLFEYFIQHSETMGLPRQEAKVIATDIKRALRMMPTSSAAPISFVEEWINNLEMVSTAISSNDKNEIPLVEKEVMNSDFQFITNAGLVILHPFLKPLFEQVGLTVNEEWKDRKSQNKAVLLTQYLVNGATCFYENELVFNKILCGFAIEDELNTQVRITAKEKAKCNDLLLAVLDYWKAMSQSSVEALRETFLIRNGKLSFKEASSIDLQVEEKGVDILLGQLPWGIGYVKTPWMEQYLSCEWN